MPPNKRCELQCTASAGEQQRVAADLRSPAAGQLTSPGLCRPPAGPAAAQLAAMATAAAWRLGRRDLLGGYLQAAEAGVAFLDAEARWEVRKDRRP
jgi:hypothetical protein